MDLLCFGIQFSALYFASIFTVKNEVTANVETPVRRPVDSPNIISPIKINNTTVTIDSSPNHFRTFADVVRSPHNDLHHSNELSADSIDKVSTEVNDGSLCTTPLSAVPKYLKMSSAAHGRYG